MTEHIIQSAPKFANQVVDMLSVCCKSRNTKNLTIAIIIAFDITEILINKTTVIKVERLYCKILF